MSYLYYCIQKIFLKQLISCFLLKITSYFCYFFSFMIWINSLLLWSFSAMNIGIAIGVLIIPEICNAKIATTIYNKSSIIKQNFSQNELYYLKNELEEKIKQLTNFAKWSCSILAACMTLLSNLFIAITPEQFKENTLQQTLQHLNLDNVIENAFSILIYITGTVLAYYFLLHCFNLRKNFTLMLITISLLSDN